MSVFMSELIGTAILVLLGNGVVANVVLNKTKGNNSGWIVITFGWAIAVFVGVYISSKVSGAHLNPAISIAFAAMGKISWALVPDYVGGQLIGAMIGSVLVWISYKKHFDATTDSGSLQAVFCTAPAINNPVFNLITEAVGTFVLVLGALFITGPDSSLGALDALPVALLVLGIGLSLGGPTGYAINPARDLGPRIMYAILPIRSKGAAGWSYGWVPVIGPIAGALIAGVVYGMLV
jgi:glycerol uptake facilitator protein